MILSIQWMPFGSKTTLHWLFFRLSFVPHKKASHTGLKTVMGELRGRNPFNSKFFLRWITYLTQMMQLQKWTGLDQKATPTLTSQWSIFFSPGDLLMEGGWPPASWVLPLMELCGVLQGSVQEHNQGKEKCEDLNALIHLSGCVWDLFSFVLRVW